MRLCPTITLSLALLSATFTQPAIAQGAAAAPPAPPPLVLATPAEEAAGVAWLKSAGHKFDPSAYGAAELAPLAARLSSARIIGIGEATHGSHQDQAFKAELIKQLVSSGKINVLVMEANREAGVGFDRYIREGKGDPVDVIRSSSFFRIWKNDEFAGLLTWLRNWNLQSDKKVRVIGIDNQDGGRDAELALTFVARFDAAAAQVLRTQLASLMPAPGAKHGRFITWFMKAPKAEVDSATAATVKLRGWFDAAPAEAQADKDFTEAKWAAETARQAFNIYEFQRDDADKSKATPEYFARRDRFMADNAIGMLGADERAVIWAHDNHVMDTLPKIIEDMNFQTLGSLLEEKLGPTYSTVGFTWSRGSFIATKLANYDAPSLGAAVQPSDVVSLPNNRAGEAGRVFDQTGASAMWIDIDARPKTPALNAWAARPYWRGWAGWGVVVPEWQKYNPEVGDVPVSFDIGHDVIVWFRAISPSRLWPLAKPK